MRVDDLYLNAFVRPRVTRRLRLVADCLEKGVRSRRATPGRTRGLGSVTLCRLAPIEAAVLGQVDVDEMVQVFFVGDWCLSCTVDEPFAFAEALIECAGH